MMHVAAFLQGTFMGTLLMYYGASGKALVLAGIGNAILLGLVMFYAKRK